VGEMTITETHLMSDLIQQTRDPEGEDDTMVGKARGRSNSDPLRFPLICWPSERIWALTYLAFAFVFQL